MIYHLSHDLPSHNLPSTISSFTILSHQPSHNLPSSYFVVDMTSYVKKEEKKAGRKLTMDEQLKLGLRW